MRRFIVVYLLLLLGIKPVDWIVSLTGDENFRGLYEALLIGAPVFMIIYAFIRAALFPRPIAVVLIEPRPRRSWFRWPSNRRSDP
jgi:hypothetical protein